MLVCTFMPSLTAAASTYGLNEEPTWFLLSVAMLYWQSILAQLAAL